MKKLLAAFVLLPFIGQAQNTDSLSIRRIADEMLTNGKAFENLRHLTKKIGGRLAGSPQMVKAENWGLSTLRQSGADTVYFQECLVPHWVRGGADQATVISVDDRKQRRLLDVLALGNSMGSGKKGVTAEVVAVASFDELEKRKDEVKGKIVFYNYPFNPTYVVPALAYRESGIYRAAGPSRAAKYGAVGVIVRSMSEGTNNHPHTGATRYNDSFPKIPAVAVGLEDADYLWQTCKGGRKVYVSFTTNGHFLPDTTGHNVIAELKGSDGSNDFITVGGHLDSWDVNEGAHDDGAGIVQTIEVLRTLKALGYKPKKTLRFVLFANEENGTRGGLKYAEQAKAKNEHHVLAIESDEGGFTPRGFGFTVGSDTLEKIRPWVKLLVPYGVYEFTAGGGGTDIGPLNKTLNTPLAGLVPDNQRYFDLHHARNDVFEAVNKRELLLGAINMAALIYLVDKYGLSL
ncbi:M20/M25/M40 family metallo-hydrolase [Segetibacter aerophilus]|uniref:Carboxypeptidase Q n=1 Tax=Segetibacter aerophilus TaxID=670293 RepID=A0A512BAL8_9BACT|nr:M20/M25/M40 family metallo-hydrolase [Segetibacter aerophilus]GEO09006.1 peptidase M28 [Segetibacter aerophilus]